MINSYYIIEDGQELGPFTHHELMERHISSDTLVLSPTMNEWQDAYYLPELQGYFHSQGVYNPSYTQPANFWWRLLAYVIDYILCSVVVGMGFVLLGLITQFSGIGINVESNQYDDLLGVIIMFTYFLYNAAFESTETRGSIGKLVCRLIVVDIEGKRIGFLKALSRNLAKILSSFLCGAGFLMILFNKNRQGLHDQLAKTYIVRKPY
jgi:uncharacterized RDD family membrane protein YckC